MTTAKQFIDACLADVGYTENPAGSNRQKYAPLAGHANGQPWCASFCVAKARQVKLLLPSESAYTPTLANGFKQTGRWHMTPEPGDLVFYDWPDGVHRIQHVGVVVAIQPDPRWLWTVEGNTSSDIFGDQSNGGGVWKRGRPRNDSIKGYGRPVWTAGEEEDDVKPEDIKAIIEGVVNAPLRDLVGGKDATLGQIVQYAHLDANGAMHEGRDARERLTAAIRTAQLSLGSDAEPGLLADAALAELHRLNSGG